MANEGFISVKNWERFQHYKLRNPPWIRLYYDLLDDYAFGQLPDDAKWLLVGLWLLASRYSNAIPADPKWIQKKINATKPVDLACLVSAGFITMSQTASAPLAIREQNATTDTETETEKKTDLSRVFEHWVQVTGRDSGKTKLTAKRSSILTARLKSWSADDLCRAVDGVMLSEHHRSKADWTDIISCFASDERVENHIARTTEQPKDQTRLPEIRSLLRAAGKLVYDPQWREEGFARAAEANPALWAKHGETVRKIRFSALKPYIDSKNEIGFVKALEEEITVGNAAA